MYFKRIWQRCTFKHIQTTYFVLTCFLIPPHVVNTESEPSSLVVGTVDESLAFVVTCDFRLEFIWQFVITQEVETDLRFILVFPQPLEHWFELVGLRVAVGAFKFFEVEFALHFQPCLHFVVVCFQLCLQLGLSFCLLGFLV